MKNVVKVGSGMALHSSRRARKEINWVITFFAACCSLYVPMILFTCHLPVIWQTASRTSVMIAQKIIDSPLKCFGQQTNSTPENSEMPHGSSIAKLRICMLRSWQAWAPVWFHRTNGQQRDALWMWSKRQPSGTSKASDWNGPSVDDKCFCFGSWITRARTFVWLNKAKKKRN